MKTIRNQTQTAQIFSACHYVYETQYHDVYGEMLVLGPSDNGKKPFIKLLDKNLFNDDDGKVQSVNLYACPRCLTVQLDEEEIYYPGECP